MSSAWFVEEDDGDWDVYETFEEALRAFLEAIWIDGAESITLRWSA